MASSRHEAQGEIEEAAQLASEIRGMAKAVENDLLPKMEASVDSEEMDFTFRCIDNFLEKVLPALGHDLDMLEKVAGSLELHSNNKTKPINSFLKGLVGANDEIPTISSSHELGETYKDLTEGERLMKFCNEFHVQDGEALLDMMHGPSTTISCSAARSRPEEGTKAKAKKEQTERSP